MSEGKLVAVIDAGASGSGVSIGELIFEGQKLGEVKIPAGLQATIRLSDDLNPSINVNSSAELRRAVVEINEQTDPSGAIDRLEEAEPEIRNEGVYVGRHDNYGESDPKSQKDGTE